MNTQKLQSFIDLVTFDQNITKLENSVQSLKQELSSLQSDVEQVGKTVEKKLLEKKKLKKELDLQELDVKKLQDKENKKIAIVEQASNSKEYDASQKELETIRADRDAAEQRLMKMFNAYETLQKDIERIEKEQEQKRSDVQAVISTKQKSLTSHEKEFNELVKQREAKTAGVPDDWMLRYNNMRGKVANPVVEIDQDSCSACFFLVSSRDLQTLTQGELVQCKDCYRFLYASQDS